MQTEQVVFVYLDLYIDLYIRTCIATIKEKEAINLNESKGGITEECWGRGKGRGGNDVIAL